MNTTSPTLLEKLRQRDHPEAWERFVRLYTPLLLVWAKRQAMQPADAADLVQDILLKLVRLLPAYERGKDQTFRGWLFRVSENQCRDFRRRVATRKLPAADALARPRMWPPNWG
jgi:RNA polymerase sigma-70 factor, ECF subfamily